MSSSSLRWRPSVIAAYSIFPGHSQAAAFQLMLYLFRSDPTHFAEPKPSPRRSAQIRSSMSSCMPRWARAAFTNMSSCGTALRSKRRVTRRKFLRFMARQDELNTLASIKGVPSAAIVAMVFFSAVFAARAPAMGSSADRAWQPSQLMEGGSTAFNPSHGSLSYVQAGHCVSKQIGRHDAAC